MKQETLAELDRDLSRLVEGRRHVKIDEFHTLIATLVVVAFILLGMSGAVHAAVIDGGFLQQTPLVREGESLTFYAPHHTPGDGFHEEHYFAQTGDIHHFAWFSATPATPGPIPILYDFRAEGGFPNFITPDQKGRAFDALSAWSAATAGKVVFVQDTLAPASGIINIGTGNLAALGFTSGPGGVLALGGGVFTHGLTTHSITDGVAWQDFAETWDTVIGNGDPLGTFDYFTVVAQEIGHAFGLGHTDNTGLLNIMNGFYTVEQTVLSAIDVEHIRSVYGGVVPEPFTLLLVGSGFAGLVAWKARRRRW